MELVAIFRMLWRRRLAVAVGAVAAVALGAMSAKETPETAIASASLMLDTPVSQLSHAAPEGADSLVARATLLANLAVTERVRTRIAAEAGVQPSDLAIVSGTSSEPLMPTALATAATDADAARPEKYVVVVRSEELVPLLSIDVLAPNRRTGVTLADAAVRTLKMAAAPDVRRDVVEPLGPAHTRVISGSSGRFRAFSLAIAAFAIWCGCLALASAVGSRRLAPFTTTATKPAR